MNLFFSQETDEEAGNLAALTFLYQLVKGAASHSYGLNVARMADLPREILELASQKSKELEDKVHSKRFALIFTIFHGGEGKRWDREEMIRKEKRKIGDEQKWRRGGLGWRRKKGSKQL